MQLLVSSAMMQKYDRLAIRGYGIPGIILMENAGRAFADCLESESGPVGGKHAVIVCGKGNNGGDGFVIARHLANRGARVSVVALSPRRQTKGDAKTNLDILLKLVAKDSAITFKEMSKNGPFPRVPHPDIIVDAIFGTGFAGTARGNARRAIRWMNSHDCLLAAVDIPSGVHADTGVVQGDAARATLTVTMGLAKIGHYVGAGRLHSGNVVVADISIPRFLFAPVREQVFRVLPKDAGRQLPKRPLTAHKHSVGKIFVLAGSRNLTGAPAMAAQSAMRAGAGAVVLGSPASIHKALMRKLTEVMVSPLPETSAGSLSLEGIGEILDKCQWADVVVIGPGLSTDPETTDLVLSLLPRVNRPVVLDADALNAVATKVSQLKKRKNPTILTPHVGELSRISREDPARIETLRVETAQRTAKNLHSVVVLKGSPTITASPSGTAYMNSTGNPGMATAGSGDVLTGLIAGLLAQGMGGTEAAYSGVLLHGLAGDLAARKYGERSIMAMDILDHLPNALKMVEA